MPKIYIFHKLLQRDTAVYWPHYGTHHVFGQLELTPHYGVTHTHHGKINCRKFTIKRSLVPLGDTPRDKGYYHLFHFGDFPTVLEYFLDEIPLQVIFMFH